MILKQIDINEHRYTFEDQGREFIVTGEYDHDGNYILDTPGGWFALCARLQRGFEGLYEDIDDQIYNARPEAYEHA